MAIEPINDSAEYKDAAGNTRQAQVVWLLNGGGGGGAVDSVNGQTGEVVLTAADVGAATAAQGSLADSATQPGDLGALATLDTVANAQIAAGAAIALNKLATGALPAAITVASANIVNGTIVDADIGASAAIATTKLAASADIAALAAARAAPVANSVDPADLAAVLVALGVMAPA